MIRSRISYLNPRISRTAPRAQGLEIEMKILIADDTDVNLDAAKTAAKAFSNHEFVFCNTATEALAKVDQVDGIITDFFFPTENNPLLHEGITIYKQKVSCSRVYDIVVRQYYENDFERASTLVDKALIVMESGTTRKFLEEEIEKLQEMNPRDKWDDKKLQKLTQILKKDFIPQLPYGGVLMLKAKKRSIRQVLTTNLHSHCSSFEDIGNSVDGMIMLIPLIEEGIITIHEAICDGGRSYVGRRIDGKESPENWIESITKLLSQ